MASAIMFHHFHNEKHPVGQGSLSAECFDALLSKIKARCNILSSDEYIHKCLHNKLSETDICLTFDDGLKCQYDVALPVLDAWDLKAFFFIPSQPLVGKAINLEWHRYFRSAFYDDIDVFYEEFFEVCTRACPTELSRALSYCGSNVYRKEHSFYSANDRLYRYFRDHCVDIETFDQIMFVMMRGKLLRYDELMNLLWMSKHEVKNLSKFGHEIGLHTHTHPTNINIYSYDAERDEYVQNLDCLSKLLGDSGGICSAATPCGLFSANTKSILTDIGVDICFGANLSSQRRNDLLELPRLDHVLF